MKHQALFSLKNKGTKQIKCCLLQFLCGALILLYSKWPKLHGVLAILSARGVRVKTSSMAAYDPLPIYLASKKNFSFVWYEAPHFL